MNRDQEMTIEIYSGTSWEAEMVTSLLTDAGIQSFLKNNLVHAYGYMATTSNDVKVIILSSDYLIAKEIVDQYIANLPKDN